MNNEAIYAESLSENQFSCRKTEINDNEWENDLSDQLNLIVLFISCSIQ